MEAESRAVRRVPFSAALATARHSSVTWQQPLSLLEALPGQARQGEEIKGTIIRKARAHKRGTTVFSACLAPLSLITGCKTRPNTPPPSPGYVHYNLEEPAR